MYVMCIYIYISIADPQGPNGRPSDPSDPSDPSALEDLVGQERQARNAAEINGKPDFYGSKSAVGPK